MSNQSVAFHWIECPAVKRRSVGTPWHWCSHPMFRREVSDHVDGLHVLKIVQQSDGGNFDMAICHVSCHAADFTHNRHSMDMHYFQISVSIFSWYLLSIYVTAQNVQSTHSRQFIPNTLHLDTNLYCSWCSAIPNKHVSSSYFWCDHVTWVRGAYVYYNIVNWYVSSLCAAYLHMFAFCCVLLCHCLRNSLQRVVTYVVLVFYNLFSPSWLRR